MKTYYKDKERTNKVTEESAKSVEIKVINEERLQNSEEIQVTESNLEVSLLSVSSHSLLLIRKLSAIIE